MSTTPDLPSSEHPPTVPPGERSASWRHQLLANHPWLGFVLPLVVFLVVTSFEPTPEAALDTPLATAKQAAADQVPSDTAVPAEQASGEQVAAQQAPAEPAAPSDKTPEPGGWFGMRIPYSAYPLIYTLKIVLSIAAVVFVSPTYRQFPLKLNPLAIVAGVIGVVLWVGICQAHLEARILPALGLQSLLDSGQRSAFNPLVELATNPTWAYGFLAIRFVGLALLVPLIEEFFLRGFLMRVCVKEDWERVSFGTVNLLAVVAGTAVPMLMHPGELLAALVWFTMITGLMVTTRNIWDCVAAHATTNLLLGIYAVVWNQWQLL